MLASRFTYSWPWQLINAYKNLETSRAAICASPCLSDSPWVNMPNCASVPDGSCQPSSSLCLMAASPDSSILPGASCLCTSCLWLYTDFLLCNYVLYLIFWFTHLVSALVSSFSSLDSNLLFLDGLLLSCCFCINVFLCVHLWYSNLSNKSVVSCVIVVHIIYMLV